MVYARVCGVLFVFFYNGLMEVRKRELEGNNVEGNHACECEWRGDERERVEGIGE